RRDGALRPQRRERGRRPRLPQRRALVPRHPGRDRADARRAAPCAGLALLRPLPRRRRGPRARARDRRRREDAMSWFLAFAGFAARIVLHELGHFAAAKAVGMRVERFSLFFPPLLLRKKVGETEYALGALPLGGYVKITGMNPDERLPQEVRDR